MRRLNRSNDILTTKTSTLGISFISHSNLKNEAHLKPEGLHLNNKGTITLSDNFFN